MTLQHARPSVIPSYKCLLFVSLCLSSLLALTSSTVAMAGDDGVAASADEQSPMTDQEETQSDSIASIVYKVMIALAALIVGFIALICSPILPVFQSNLEPEVVVEHVGENANLAGKKVLVAYFTRHGTAASIAEKIYGILSKKGFRADMRFIGNIQKNEDLAQYDAFIIGSAVYWAMAKDFIDFVADYKNTLVEKPVAVFSCCLTIQRETPKNLERVAAYIESGLKHVPELKPIDKVAFAGKVEMPKLTFPEKAFLWFLFTVTPQQGGDHRNWNKISAWAENIATKF